MLFSILLVLQHANVISTSSSMQKPSYLDYKLKTRFSRNLNRVDGGWSDWSLYSLCSVTTCTESWVRYCNNPRPANDGITCSGENIRKLKCRDTSQCGTDALVAFSIVRSGSVDSEDQVLDDSFEGSLTSKQWGPWGKCSVTCGVGVKTRIWSPCDDVDCKTQEQPCFNIPCTSLNGYSQWTEWGACVDCHQTRSRVCHFDQDCQEETQMESQRCNCAVDTATMSPCEIQRQTQLSFGGVGYIVKCKVTGEYISRQCDLNVGQCWCVYSTSGQEVVGTRHPAHTGPYPCDTYTNLTTCLALKEVKKIQTIDNTAYDPTCLSDGRFGRLQVNNDLNLKWCTHKDGLAVYDTVKNINEYLSCDTALTSKTKCQSTPGASCKANGLFEMLQCEQAGYHKLCYCAYADGQSKQRTESTEPNLPECNIYSDLSLTKCQAESIHWKVTCLPSGEFAPEQCTETVCYCVDESGEPLHGTEKPVDAQRITPCEDLMNMRSDPTQFSETFPTTTEMLIPDTTASQKNEATEPTPTLPPITVSSPEVLDNLEYVQYGEWSDWSECTEECNGGYQTATKECPIKGGACGGPDTSTRFSECNMLPCIPVTIDHFSYTWDNSKTTISVLCRAIGLPKPFVVIRADGFVVADEQTEIEGYTEVAYSTTPLTNTSYMCIATGEFQDRKYLEVTVQKGNIDEFSSSVSALYVGQQAILFCQVSGTPLPLVQLLENGKAMPVNHTVPNEVVKIVRPTTTTTYTCVAESKVSFVDDSISLEIVVLNPCDGVVCHDNSRCVPNEGGSSCVCDECANTTLNTKLVCGSNCVTYNSLCELNRQICLSEDKITLFKEMSCDDIRKPKINGTCVPMLAKRGDTVTLKCDTQHTTRVSWYKAGSSVEIGTGPTLTLYNVELSADYTCKAENCVGSKEITCSVYVQDRDTEECVQYGAGHFHQFSNAIFNYPGICHYVLAMDCMYGSFYIYTGTSQCGTAEMPLAYTSSITVFVGREAVVLLRGFDINEFGVTKHLTPGQEIHYQNFRIWRDVELMYLKHRDQNFTLAWDGLTAVQLTISRSYSGMLCGLCGDVGITEPNAVEDVIGHGSTFEVDRYDQCNLAVIPTNTCSSKKLENEAQMMCTRALYNKILVQCHDHLPVEEFMDACIFDTCGVKWYSGYQTGLCNVVGTYAHMCSDLGVDVSGWRDLTPCRFSMMEKVAYLSRRKRRRKRNAGFSPWDIMMSGN